MFLNMSYFNNNGAPYTYVYTNVLNNLANYDIFYINIVTTHARDCIISNSIIYNMTAVIDIYHISHIGFVNNTEVFKLTSVNYCKVVFSSDSLIKHNLPLNNYYQLFTPGNNTYDPDDPDNTIDEVIPFISIENGFGTIEMIDKNRDINIHFGSILTYYNLIYIQNQVYARSTICINLHRIGFFDADDGSASACDSVTLIRFDNINKFNVLDVYIDIDEVESKLKLIQIIPDTWETLYDDGGGNFIFKSKSMTAENRFTQINLYIKESIFDTSTASSSKINLICNEFNIHYI